MCTTIYPKAAHAILHSLGRTLFLCHALRSRNALPGLHGKVCELRVSLPFFGGGEFMLAEESARPQRKNANPRQVPFLRFSNNGRSCFTKGVVTDCVTSAQVWGIVVDSANCTDECEQQRQPLACNKQK